MHRREQFAKIVLEYQAPLRAFVRMLGVAPHAVDDLTQDTFVVAYQRWDTLDSPENTGKWLRGIARNLVRNELRKQSRRRRLMSSALTETLLEREDEESPAEAQGPWLEALDACLDTLPRQSRRIVQARYQQGSTSPEVADELQMSADAVRQALLRIRRQLKSCVESRLKDSEP